ncbi:serine/threonine protein kinase [Candidatus Scalindua japonica]|uniref:Serine/threonine protein kinase n=2 Tax=Candidatus Scalindua japonica TaxID=1284222 RepID=A0A286TV01_9BACT|nr:serine/threonine protein kinase [Candidatus Scalindua japonica]
MTLYIKKEYENRMSDDDIKKLFDLCKKPLSAPNVVDRNELSNSYIGRASCKTLSMDGLADDRFVVREYWHGGMIGRIFRDCFWEGMRPVNELLVSEAVSNGGVKTAEIIAIVKKRVMGRLYKFRMVTREITESIDLIELLLHSRENQLLKQKKQIINKLAKAVNDMHNVGIYHADLHLKNILVQSNSGICINVYIIDLDKSHQYEKLSFHRRMKNIMRLDRSVVKMRRKKSNLFGKTFPFPVSKTDRIRFLKRYIETGSESVKPIKYYIQSYSKAHGLHRLWWSLGGG